MSSMVIDVHADYGFNEDAFVKEILTIYPHIDILSPDLIDFQFIFTDIKEGHEALTYLASNTTIKIKCLKIDYDR